MKRFIVALLMVLFLVPVAYSETIQWGYPICSTKEYMEDMVSFSVSGDSNSFYSYYRSGKCMTSKPFAGTQVYVIDRTWTGLVQFSKNGTKLWTIREGIK